MITRFNERPGSRRATSSPPSFEVGYICAGEFDSGNVKLLASALTGTIVSTAEGLLYRNNIVVTEQGYQLFHVDVSYGPDANAVGNLRFSGSTTGGTFHITHSRSTVNKYPGSAVDHKQGINVRMRNGQQEIEGTDIIIPALKLSYTVQNPIGVVNEDFARNLARMTSRVNSDTWRGFAAGELLFLGADFSQGTDTIAECTYHFAAEENLSGLIVGSITGIAKDGHDLLWVSWEDDNTGDKPATKPTAVYIERVYNRVSFASAFGF
jgi:hypothetical protein